MRIAGDTPFWLVTDPRPTSEPADILLETTLSDLALQLKGGLTAEENPTIFTEHAEAEARRRMVAMRARQAIARATAGVAIEDARRVQLVGEDGQLNFEAELL